MVSGTPVMETIPTKDPPLWQPDTAQVVSEGAPVRPVGGLLGFLEEDTISAQPIIKRLESKVDFVIKLSKSINKIYVIIKYAALRGRAISNEKVALPNKI